MTKSLRLYCSFLALFFLCAPTFAQLHLHSYYPQELVEAVESDKESEELREKLYQTLAGVHLQVEGERDIVLEKCPEDLRDNARCLEQLRGMSYKEARKFLFGLLHLEQQGRSYTVQDQYCLDDFDERDGVGPMRIPNHQVINCEHTWPQSRFNSRYSRELQKTDLHHLFPVSSRANSSRGNIIFGEVAKNQSSSLCQASKRGPSTSKGTVSFEPPDAHKGNVARSLFYFAVRYKVDISEEEEAYLRKWNQEDPVDQEERVRNEKIYELQGNRNPFIDDPELASLMKDL